MPQSPARSPGQRERSNLGEPVLFRRYLGPPPREGSGRRRGPRRRRPRAPRMLWRPGVPETQVRAGRERGAVGAPNCPLAGRQ